MNRNLLRALALFGCSTFALYAGSVTLYPTSPGVSNVSGNTGTSAPGFGSGSFASPADGSKSEIYVTPGQLFGHSVTVSDLASLSYFTNKPGDAGSPDWSLYIYTAPVAGDTSFYHSRLTAEPYFTSTPNASDPAGAWHQWSTDDPSNPLRFYDANRDGGIFGTYTDPTLATLQSGPFTWPNNTTNDYRNETVLYFSLQTGSQWAGNFTGLVDGFTVTLNDRSTGTVNLEAATPEPGTMALLCGGALGLLALRRRK